MVHGLSPVGHLENDLSVVMIGLRCQTVCVDFSLRRSLERRRLWISTISLTYLNPEEVFGLTNLIQFRMNTFKKLSKPRDGLPLAATLNPGNLSLSKEKR